MDGINCFQERLPITYHGVTSKRCKEPISPLASPSIQQENFEDLSLKDDERSPDVTGTQSLLSSPIKTKPPWDAFKNLRVKKKRSSDKSGSLTVPLMILKAFSYPITAGLVLGSSCLANVTLFLMTSQLTTNRTMNLCVEVENKQFVVNSPPVERAGWLCGLCLCLVVPEIILLLKSFWVCFFKKIGRPSFTSFFIVFTTESLQACGLSLLVFWVFSRMTGFRITMLTNTLGLVPALLLPLSRSSWKGGSFCLTIICDIASFFCFIAYFVFLSLNSDTTSGFFQRYVEIPLAVLLTSLGWWENFIKEETNVPVLKCLAKTREDMNSENNFHLMRLILAPWKILLFITALCIYVKIELGNISDLLGDIKNSFKQTDVAIIPKWPTTESALDGSRGQYLYSGGTLPLYVVLVHLASTQVCYLASVFAAKIKIHPFAFSLSISISASVSLMILSALCSYRKEKECFMDSWFPAYVFWTCPTGDFVQTFLHEEFGWSWILVIVGQAWITSYIWRVRDTERFFLDTLQLSPIICQALLFQKRKHFEKQMNKPLSDELPLQETSSDIQESPSPKPKIYGCATMWHENKSEMMTIIKSIMCLDNELADNIDRSKTFTFELHIFFDDAFSKPKSQTVDIKTQTGIKTINMNTPLKYQLNSYVKDLVHIINKAAKEMYPKRVIRKIYPTKIITPYGGRLEWTLPGQTLIKAHLKDKEVVRHKKRWSQVMYLFYLLGYQLMDKHKGDELTSEEAKTFILALDGDIDFKPDAIFKLLDLMLKDKNLGAACGRIHPVGSGPIVWYQKFEYAIGHWFQKATEHVLGCVLCSPGCFSLFRASALIEVTKQYSSEAELPLHRLQYDQGEDRWLCTLILKRGYKIEYSAASDAYTNAPDSFSDFYIQRKRWGPSTMANIFDIIKDYKVTVTENENISRPYILYQLIMMIGSLVGPGTILLMVVGAMTAAFQVTSWIAFVLNIVPVIIFAAICFTMKSKYQLSFAMLLSALYALLMLAVFVGTCLQLKEEGVASPTGVFMVVMAASFIVAGVLHPQEMNCLLPGLLYFLLVPSMYLLLTIYSFVNLNDISWGTREDPNQKTEADSKTKESEPKNKKNLFNDFAEWLGLDNSGSAISKLNCCNCFGMETKTSPEEIQLLERNYQAVDSISNRITSVEDNTQVILQALSNQPLGNQRAGLSGIEQTSLVVPASPKWSSGATNALKVPESPNQHKKKVTDSVLPKDKRSWIYEKCIEKGAEETLEPSEEIFWKYIIKKYLKPKDDMNEDEKKTVKRELKMLRNKVVFVFLMMNSFFILVVFLLQINKDHLFIEWPFNYKSNIKFSPVTNTITITKKKLQIDPVGIVFAIVFGMLLCLQLIGMVIHRFSTFMHIMADTVLDCKSCKCERESLNYYESESEEEETKDKKQIKRLTKKPGDRRVSVHMLALQNRTKVKFETLQDYHQHKRERQRRESLALLSREMSGRRRSNASAVTSTPPLRSRRQSLISAASSIFNSSILEEDEN